jgi:transposase-like protein
MTHKSEDYKISAVKYYLKNKDNIRKTCKIFDCKKSTLQRWIHLFFFSNKNENIMNNIFICVYIIDIIYLLIKN